MTNKPRAPLAIVGREVYGRPMQRTPKHRLADALLPDGLDLFVESRRASKWSWRRIALELRDRIDVDITPESLRSWYTEDDRIAS